MATAPSPSAEPPIPSFNASLALPLPAPPPLQAEPPAPSNATIQSPPPPPDVVSAPPPSLSPPPIPTDPPVLLPPPPLPSPPNVPPPPPSSDPPKSSPTLPPPPPSDLPISSPPPPLHISSPPPPTLSPPINAPPSTITPPENLPPPPPPNLSPINAPPSTITPPEGSPPPPQPPEQSSPPPPPIPSDTLPKPPPEISPPLPPALVPPSLIPPPQPSSQPTPPAQPDPPPALGFSPPPPLHDTPPPASRIPSPSAGVPNATIPGPTVPASSNATSNKGIGTGGVAAISVVAVVVVLSFIASVVWCTRRKRRKKVYEFGGPPSMTYFPQSDPSFFKKQSSGPSFFKKQSSGPSFFKKQFLMKQSSAPVIGSFSGSDMLNSPRAEAGGSNSRPWFTHDELVEATNGFSSENILGKGGFGSVYKGVLPDKRLVAVKQLEIGGGQGEREFKAEVETISRVHHRNLVCLVGYCICEKQRLLVYEYIAKDSLDSHLHGEGRRVLGWDTRVKIAAGAARGIAYLHDACYPRIIHRDIKSSNILLDDNLEARVSDFGLARFCQDKNTHVTTGVMGTFGYLAPDYALTGKLTEKSDVYAFGVVLLELITGRKAVDRYQPVGEESLVGWARPLMSSAIENEDCNKLVDPRLENFDENEVLTLIKIAASCVRHSAANRPGMGQVVRTFDSMRTVDLSNGMTVGKSEAFNSSQQSASIQRFHKMVYDIENCGTVGTDVTEDSKYISEA